MQADVSEEERKPEAQEKDGEKCEFDKSLELMLLQSVATGKVKTYLCRRVSRSNMGHRKV